MLKRCIKMFNLICSDHNFLLETVDIPIILLLQPDPLHNLTYFVFNWAIFWMIRWPWDNGEVARTDTVCHSVVDVHTVMRGEVVPDKYSMKVSAGDIVRLNIPADIIAKISKDIDCCSNSTPASDPSSRSLNATTNMWSQGRIPRLYRKDHDCNFYTVVVVSILTDTMHLCGPSPRAVTLF